MCHIFSVSNTTSSILRLSIKKLERGLQISQTCLRSTYTGILLGTTSRRCSSRLLVQQYRESPYAVQALCVHLRQGLPGRLRPVHDTSAGCDARIEYSLVGSIFSQQYSSSEAPPTAHTGTCTYTVRVQSVREVYTRSKHRQLPRAHAAVRSP